jgi:hypothetical protein
MPGDVDSLRQMSFRAACSLKSFVDGTASSREFAWISSMQEPQVSWDLARELELAGLQVALEVALPGLHRSMRIPVVALHEDVLGVFKVTTSPTKVDESVLDCKKMVERAIEELSDRGPFRFRGVVVLAGRARAVTQSSMSDHIRLVRIEDVGHGVLG